MPVVSEEMVLVGAKALFLRDVEEDVCDGTWDENGALHERILADARACLTAGVSVNAVRPSEICNVLRSLSLKTIGNDAADTIEALQTQIAALTAALSDQVAGWQPIETAPRKAHILIACADGVVREGYWGVADYNRSKKSWVFGWVSHPNSGDHKPTHWQPLPAPPSSPAAGE